MKRRLLDPDPGTAGGGANPPANPPAQTPPANTQPQDGQPPSQPKEGDTPPADQPKPDAPPTIVKDDPLLASLVADLGIEPTPAIKAAPDADATPDANAKPEDKKDEPKDQPAAPPADAKKDGEPAPGKPKKPAKKSLLASLDAPAPAATTQPQAPAQPAAQPAAADPDAEYIKGLTDEQKEELREAEVAEQLFPDKYKGHKKKLIEFYRRFDTEVTKLVTDNPSRRLDSSDEDYQRILDAKPKMDRAAEKKVQRHIGSEEVTKKVAPEITELRVRQEVMEYTPQVEGVVGQVREGFDELVKADDKSPLSEALKANAPDAAEAYRLEREIYDDEKDRLLKLTREYLFLSKSTKDNIPLRPYDERNEVHAEVVNFIRQQCDLMARQSEELTVRDGKRFLTRDQYYDLPPHKRAGFWTFGHKDIIQMMGIDAKDRAERRIQSEVERLKERGFVRQRKPVSAPAPKVPADEPKPLTPPKAVPTAAPGPGSPAPVLPGKGAAAAGGEPISVVDVFKLNTL